MALAPKSNNLPEMQPEALVKAEVATPNLIAGNENAVEHKDQVDQKRSEEGKPAAALERVATNNVREQTEENKAPARAEENK